MTSRVTSGETIVTAPTRLLEQVMADGVAGGLRAVGAAGLAEDRPDMVGDSVLADEQQRADLGVGQPGRHTPQHLDLTIGQVIREGGQYPLGATGARPVTLDLGDPDRRLATRGDVDGRGEVPLGVLHAPEPRRQRAKQAIGRPEARREADDQRLRWG